MRFKSLQWKIMVFFCLLTLIAMEFMGIFVTQNIRDYYLGSFEDSLRSQAGLLSWSAEPYLTGEEVGDDLQDMVKTFADSNESFETVAILDAMGRTVLEVTRSGEVGENYAYREEVILALSEGEAMTDGEENTVPYKYYATTIEKDGEVLGVLYLKAGMRETYTILSNIRRILLSGTGAAILMTLILAFFMARTITRPIRKVTEKTESLAKGEYGEMIEVKSHDEIGQLTDTFNYLSRRLRETLTEIENEKSKMEAIFNYMNDGVLAFNLTGDLILLNRAAARMLHLDEEAALNIREEKSPLQAELKSSILQALNDREHFVQAETLLNTAEKEYFRVNIAPFRDDRAQTAGLVLVLNNVTEQEKLQHMQREFVANVSHEMRTPLTVVRSYAETLLSGAMEDRETAIRFLTVIESESVRMTNLVKDLLDLSQLDYKETRWKKASLELNAIMPLIHDKIVIAAREKNQTLLFKIGPEPLWLFADRERIEQVIINIISNAVKYTEEEGLIVVSTRREGDWAEITIRDNGMGIPPEDLPRIFERFYRVDKARSRSMGGTGLGLSIAQQIVDAHKGTIRIESEGLHKGTTVTLRFPLEMEAQPEMPEAKPEMESKSVNEL